MNPLGKSLWVHIIGISLLISLNGILMTASAKDSKTNPGRKISLVPVGDIDHWILEALKSRLESTFKGQVDVHQGMKLPKHTYNPQRKQFFSSQILKELRTFINPSQDEKVLAVSDVDLYVPRLNFVFGEAELGGHFALISLMRLRQSFYGMPENKSLFLERTLKEAVHELGHTYGLDHCPDLDCVMHFSNSLQDTDRKSASFCLRCQRVLD